ncbi:hypothetical protein PMAYCL1PPCAC_04544, partial [Pristionchus mayeri]
SDRVHHNEIAKSLTYQALLPMGHFMGTVYYWSVQKYLPLSCEFSERILTMALTIICLASPIINIMHLPPYRRFIITPTTPTTKHRTSAK